MSGVFWFAAVFVLSIVAVADSIKCFNRYAPRHRVHQVINGVNESCIVVFSQTRNYTESIDFCQKRYIDSTLLRKENEEVLMNELKKSQWTTADVSFWVDKNFGIEEKGKCQGFSDKLFGYHECDAKLYVTCQYPFRYSCGYSKRMKLEPVIVLNKTCDFVYEVLEQQNDNDHWETCSIDEEEVFTYVPNECQCLKDYGWSNWSYWSKCDDCTTRKQRERSSKHPCGRHGRTDHINQSEYAYCNIPLKCRSSFTSKTSQSTRAIQMKTAAASNKSAEAKTTSIGTKAPSKKRGSSKADKGADGAAYMVSGGFAVVGVAFILCGLVCCAISKFSTRRDPKPLGLMKMTPKPM